MPHDMGNMVFLYFPQLSANQKVELFRFIRKRSGKGYSLKEFVQNKPGTVYRDGKIYGYSEILRIGVK